MGCTQSSEERAAAAKSKKIDKTLRKDKKIWRKVKVILLLGARDSGKCTIMMQVRMINVKRFSEEELREYRVDAYSNIIAGINDVLKDMKSHGSDFKDMARAEDARQLPVLASSTADGVMSEELAGVIRRIWRDEGVQDFLCSSPELYLRDTTLLFLNNQDQTNWATPTKIDLLCSMNKTKNIIEAKISLKDKLCWLLDLRWNNFMGKVFIRFQVPFDVIVFCAALSDYDQLDNSRNRMEESLDLFKSICNESLLSHIPIVLLFTMKDLFEEKISRIPLSTCFPEYSGANTYEEAANYIQARYEILYQSRSTEQNTKLCTLFTCARDADSVRSAFNTVADII